MGRGRRRVGGGGGGEVEGAGREAGEADVDEGGGREDVVVGLGVGVNAVREGACGGELGGGRTKGRERERYGNDGPVQSVGGTAAVRGMLVSLRRMLSFIGDQPRTKMTRAGCTCARTSGDVLDVCGPCC